jgi:hypothetical protein
MEHNRLSLIGSIDSGVSDHPHWDFYGILSGEKHAGGADDQSNQAFVHHSRKEKPARANTLACGLLSSTAESLQQSAHFLPGQPKA